MENEKRLIPFGKKCALDELPCGTLFAFGDDCIALKSEYRCGNGLIEAHIVGSGEQFWGGAKNAIEQNALMVQPLGIVEVVHGHWFWKPTNEYTRILTCSVCGRTEGADKHHKYCPNCGAKMDGDRNA